MPRVFSKTANRGAKSKRTCDRCGKPIKAGQRFYTWKFRYGARYYRHTEHGAPRGSELTHSKASGLYAAQESVEDTLAAWSGEDASEIAEALREAANSAEEVKDEYEESINNMPEQLQESSPAAEEMRERMDAIEQWKDDLDSAASDIEGMEPEEVDRADIEREVAEEMIREAEDNDPEKKGPLTQGMGAGGDPVALVREHLDFAEFERRVEEKVEEAEQEKRDEFKTEVEEKANEALGSLSI